MTSHCVLPELVLTVEVTAIITYLQVMDLRNEHESLCLSVAVRRAISVIPAVPHVRTTQVRIT